MRPSPSIAAFVLLLCGACSSDPDIVATSRPNNLDIEENKNCEQGTYKGRFFTWPSDAGGISLSGTIEFSLVRSQRGGEFLELGPNTKLEGKDLEARAYFTADVRTERCVAGSYQTDIENGKFSGLDENDNPTESYIPFIGTISGSYSPESRTFAGRWETTTGLSTLGGGWVAVSSKKQ